MQQIPSGEAKMKTIPLFSVAKQGSILQGDKLITKGMESSWLIGPFYAPSASPTVGDLRIRFPWQWAITLTGRKLGGSGGCLGCCFWRKKTWLIGLEPECQWEIEDVMTWDLFVWTLVVDMSPNVVQFLVLLGQCHTDMLCIGRHENTISYSDDPGVEAYHI